MVDVVSENREAVILTETLWKYFAFQLYCRVVRDDGRPSTIRCRGIAPDGNQDVRIFIAVRRNSRTQEALVHELLHADLIREGYPKFWLHEQEAYAGDAELAAWIINYAEHFPMKEKFRTLRYEPARFLGNCQQVTRNEDAEEAKTFLDGVADDLLTPNGFQKQVSCCLRESSLKFEVCWVSQQIARKRKAMAASA